VLAPGEGPLSGNVQVIAAAAGGNAELATLQRIATQLDEVLALLRKRDGG
jgi:hypothetical protein